MSDIFTGLYDQIFLKDIENLYNGDEISSITKRFLEGNASVAEKKYFVKLKTQYCKIKNIKDYNKLQKQLYNGKSRYDVISFEIARILKNERYDIKFSDEIANIEKLSSINKEQIPDHLYEKIINLILRIELSLGMKIGLFEEFCSLFETEMKKVNDLEIGDTLKYNRTK